MKPSSELFDLVKSLSKSEKRFFKLSSSLQQGDKNYLKIFDIIDRQDQYNEDEIKETFAGETFVKHLPSEKNHLYRLIMKSLRSFHADNSISAILKQELKNIEILYKKALYRECNKFVARAKRMAVENEKFYYLFELLSWEKLLLEEAYESGEFTTDLDGLIKEEQDVIEKLRNLAAYHVLYSKINYVFRSGGYVRSDADRALVEEISHHPLIIGRNTAISHRAATICYYIQGFCATAKVDKHTAIQKFTKVKQILDDHPQLRNDLTNRYMRALSNIMSLQIDLDMIVEARASMKAMKDMAEKPAFQTDDIANMVYRDTTVAELRLLQKTGDYRQALAVVDELIRYMENPLTRLNKEQELVLNNVISTTYFGAGSYREALHWVNKVLNDNETNLRQDIYGYARVFNLVVHYELGNYDLLEYAVKSTHRFLSKRQRDHDLELVIISNMRKLGKAAMEGNEKQVLRQFSEEVESAIQHAADQIILEHFNYPLWIESKLKEVTLAEAAASAMQRRNQSVLKA